MVKRKRFLRLSTITIMKKATTPEIVLSQKTSDSFSDSYVGDYQLEDLIAIALYLVSSQVSGNKPGQ